MSVPSPRTLFRTLAAAEMVTWALLLLSLALKYGGVTEALTPLAGGLHGFTFLSYAVVTVAVWVDGRWPVARGLLGLASAVIPFMTVPFERSAERRGELHGRWLVRDRPAGERRPHERLLAIVLAHPVVSVVAALVSVTAVFWVLLQAGPPTEWGR